MGRRSPRGARVAPGLDASAGPVVLVFGELGIGNLGNEASLTEALRRLDAQLPGAQVRVLSYVPERTVAEHRGEHPRWSAVPINAPARAARVVELPGRWGVLARQVADAGRVARASRGADVVVVPGTGIFEELWMGPWGVPVLLVGLAVGARAHRVPLAVVAVGADLPRRRLTRWMFSLALRSATLATFRDDHSRAAGTAMTSGRAAAPRLDPDLVLGAPAPDVTEAGSATPDDGRPRVVLGVMRYFGESDDEHSPAGAAVHERYLATLTDVGERILARGWSVDVVVGDGGDVPVARALGARLGTGARVRAVTTLRELDELVAGSTAVVASRYHNVVSAIRAAVPVVSISYGPKGHALMAQVGMGSSCQWIEELDADALVEQLDDAVARSAEVAVRLREATAALRAAADRPWEDVAALAGFPAGAARSPVPHPARQRGSALVEERA